MELLKITNLEKTYKNGNIILKNINLTIHKGEFISIIGKSGEGKSTFLNLIGGLDTPNSGEIYINKVNITKLKENDKTIFRRRNIGIVYQNYNLLPSLTAKENILLPAKLDKRNIKENYLYKLMKDLKIKELENRMPYTLSGGQKQRVAIARALINEPELLLLDEPTGNLDPQTTKQVMKKIKYYNKVLKQTIILVTHDLNLANTADKIFELKDGTLYEQTN